MVLQLMNIKGLSSTVAEFVIREILCYTLFLRYNNRV